MPWPTPTLQQQRINARNYIMAALPGADAMVPNSVLRVLADVNAGESHLNLQFLAWLALMFLPITNTDIWLDRWADMYLVNADASKGRKQATFATGTAIVVSNQSGIVIPAGTFATGGNGVTYQTTEQVTTGSIGGILPLIALTAGVVGNLGQGAMLNLSLVQTGVTPAITIVSMAGGTDTETDDELRVRLLLRLANPPMGGDAQDYVAWAMNVPGVTRAWASPQEQGIGTMTVRFMMDDLRASTGGFPTQDDVNTVAAYIDTVRPVTVKDFFVEAPVPQAVNFTINNLDPDTTDVWANIITSVRAMFFAKAAPAQAINGAPVMAQTIFAAWVSDSILQAAGVVSFDLVMNDAVMANPGNMAVLGTATHGFG